MIIGKIVLGAGKAIGKFFSSKAGKAALGAGAAAGVASAGVGVGKAASASRKNKQAKDIQEEAVKIHSDSLEETEKVLAKLTEQEKYAIDNFDRFLKITEKINRCPDIREFKSKSKLQKITVVELKELSNAFEIALNGVGGAGLGCLAGIAFCGVSIAALSFVALGGGVALCVKGQKLSSQAAKNVREAKKMRKQVESIVEYYEKLQMASKELENAFKTANGLYKKKLNKLEKIVDKETDYQKFTKEERLLVKNCFKLTCLLADMCDTKLAIKKGEEETVNVKEINLICEKANNVVNESKQDVFEKVFA